MPYFVAVIIGYVILFLLTTVLVCRVNHVAMSREHIIRRAYVNNTFARAMMVSCDQEDSGLYTARYQYQYRGVMYEYVKHFFSETPTDSVELVWKKGNPGQPVEADDIEFDKKKYFTNCLFPILIALGVALVVPQAIVFTAVVIYCVWRVVPNVWGAAAATAVCVLVILGMYGSMPMYTSYEHEAYETVAATMPEIDQLEPIDVCNLYDEWYTYNYSYQDWQEIRSIPMVCQFGDSWWEGKERIEWPAKYYKYTDWEYRDRVEEEYRDANP